MRKGQNISILNLIPPLDKKKLYSGFRAGSWNKTLAEQRKRQMFIKFKRILLRYRNNIKYKESFLYGLRILRQFFEKFKVWPNNKKIYTTFSNFFYKEIRSLQRVIHMLRSKIVDLAGFKLLEHVSAKLFASMYQSVTILVRSKQCAAIINSRDSKLYNCRCPNQSIEGEFCKQHQDAKPISVFDFLFFHDQNTKLEQESFLSAKKLFQIDVKLINNKLNVYLFILYLKLYALEEQLQWCNWVLFRLHIDSSPYKFNYPYSLISFLETIQSFGYQFWHSKTFRTKNQKVITKKFKLKKKWRFWREFKKYFLFDKTHMFIKFRWLHNYKRILNHQYAETYRVDLKSKLSHIYRKKISKGRLFSYLLKFDYRIDILSTRIFNIKHIKWTWTLLYFGYLTINFKPVKRYYILKVNDIIFGFFLLANFNFFNKISFRRRNSRQLYCFLERELKINTFICLTPPLRYSSILSNKDRLISKKFIKYTYLSTY